MQPIYPGSSARVADKRRMVHFFFILIHFCTKITKIYIVHLLLDLKNNKNRLLVYRLPKNCSYRTTYPKLIIHGKMVFILAEEKKMFFMKISFMGEQKSEVILRESNFYTRTTFRQVIFNIFCRSGMKNLDNSKSVVIFQLDDHNQARPNLVCNWHRRFCIFQINFFLARALYISFRQTVRPQNEFPKSRKMS